MAEVFQNLIAIEGGDGAGKGTQAELLRKYVSEELGRHVMKISFPRYNELSSRYVGRYLNGQYGEANDIHPDLGSLPYSIDRLVGSSDIRNFFIQHPDGVGILDRFTASNMAHQGAKIDDPEARRFFYEEMLELEHDILQIPKPAKSLVLLVSTGIAQANVDKKDASTRTYTTKQRDIHEADPTHLDRARANYEELCRLYPAEFTPIYCDSGEAMRSLDDIQNDVRTELEDILKVA